MNLKIKHIVMLSKLSIMLLLSASPLPLSDYQDLITTMLD